MAIAGAVDGSNSGYETSTGKSNGGPQANTVNIEQIVDVKDVDMKDLHVDM